MSTLAARLRRSPFVRTAMLTRRYLRQTGWLRSLRESACVDKNGDALPWYTYSAIDFLSGRITADMAVFEFGCGNSTIWWAKRCQSVIAVESSADWVTRVRPLLPQSAVVSHEAESVDGAYAHSVLSGESNYDVIVVDGIDRNNCLHYALSMLRLDGVVVWDNSDRRDDYSLGFAELTRHGFREIYLSGLGPLNAYGWATSVFYRDSNCMGI
jgi:precorrin-6B methylase 2